MNNIVYNLNIILDDVIQNALSIGFPVSNNMERKIYIDKKTYDRVGACYRYKFPERYEIHLSEDTLRASKKHIKNIIAHEVLHANIMTIEHNVFWQTYCDLMNDKFGYNIKLTYSWDEILK